MSTSIKPRYINENGITYYRTSIINYNNINGRFYGNDIRSTSMNEFTSLEVYGNSSSGSPLLCYVISSFNRENKIDISYIFYNDEELLPSIKHDNTLHIYDMCDSNSKLIYINIKNYINKLLTNITYDVSFSISYRPVITVYCYMKLNNYKLRIEKSINFYPKYIKDFKNIPINLKKDLEDISKLAVDVSSLNKNRVEYVLKNILHLSDYNLTNRKFMIALSKFNNIKIIYNNYNGKRIPTSIELEMFDSFKEYNSILKNLNLQEKKYIQLKGIKFCLFDKIYIMDGFTTYDLYSVTDDIKQYILTVCDIEALRSEIEKLIMTS